MNFPKFWAKGSHNDFSCWRWSDTRRTEAETLAQAAAQKLAERFANGDDFSRIRYGYADRPMREPVLSEFKDGAGHVTAAITRNSYGCLVLNTSCAMFVDVDLPEPKSSGGGWFGKLLKNRAGDERWRSACAGTGRGVVAAESQPGLARLSNARWFATARHLRVVRSGRCLDRSRVFRQRG